MRMSRRPKEFLSDLVKQTVFFVAIGCKFTRFLMIPLLDVARTEKHDRDESAQRWMRLLPSPVGVLLLGPPRLKLKGACQVANSSMRVRKASVLHQYSSLPYLCFI